MEFGTDGEKRYFVFKHNDGSKSSLEFYNNGVNLVRYDPKTTQWEIIWSIPVTVKYNFTNEKTFFKGRLFRW